MGALTLKLSIFIDTTVNIADEDNSNLLKFSKKTILRPEPRSVLRVPCGPGQDEQAAPLGGARPLLPTPARAGQVPRGWRLFVD